MNNIILITHNIRSLFNIGSLFRSADCFGISKIYLTGYTAKPPRNEISKTALGAEQIVPWEYSKQLPKIIRKLQSECITVIALETIAHATPLPEFKPPSSVAILIGNEVTGISKQHLALCDEIIRIPMLGSKESLNVAVAAAIAMYAIRYSKEVCGLLRREKTDGLT